MTADDIYVGYVFGISIFQHGWAAIPPIKAKIKTLVCSRCHYFNLPLHGELLVADMK